MIKLVCMLLAGMLALGCAGCAAQAEAGKNEEPAEAPVTQTPTATPSPAATPAPASAPTPEAAMAPAPTPTPAPTPEGMVMLTDGFTHQPIPEDVKGRMAGKSYAEDCTVPYEELRYLQMLHVGFDGQDEQGEMVVNVKIADDVLEIFRDLYEAGYPIERMVLIDEYDANDEASMTDNNTSSFCYRTISGTNKLSYHARGLAVDVNPLYNPYVSDKKIEPAAGEPYTDRSIENEYYIDEDDLCYRLFTEHGFFWGGHWNSVKDYQHFEMQD